MIRSSRHWVCWWHHAASFMAVFLAANRSIEGEAFKGHNFAQKQFLFYMVVSKMFSPSPYIYIYLFGEMVFSSAWKVETNTDHWPIDGHWTPLELKDALLTTSSDLWVSLWLNPSGTHVQQARQMIWKHLVSVEINVKIEYLSVTFDGRWGHIAYGCYLSPAMLFERDERCTQG